MQVDVAKASTGDALCVAVLGTDSASEYARLVLHELLAATEKRTMTGTQWWELPIHEFLEFKRKLDAAGHNGERLIDDDAWNAVGLYLREIQDATELKQGLHNDDIDWSIFHTQPYPDQHTAIRFLASQWRALDADEMGLGKSLTALYTDQLWRRYGFVERTLVLCPNSVKSGWQKEIRKHTPNASYLGVSNGTGQVLSDLAAYVAKPTDYLIVHYDCLVERKSQEEYTMPQPSLEILLDKHLHRALGTKHKKLADRILFTYQHPIQRLHRFSDMTSIRGVSPAVFKKVVAYVKSKKFPGHLITRAPPQRAVLDAVLKLPFCNVIIDEFHCLKDPEAGRTQAVMEILNKVKPTPKELAEVSFELEDGARAYRVVNLAVQPLAVGQEVDLRDFL